MQKSPTDQFFQDFINLSPTRNAPPLPSTRELHHPKPVKACSPLQVQQLEGSISLRQSDQEPKTTSQGAGPFLVHPHLSVKQTGVKRDRESDGTPEPAGQAKRIKQTSTDADHVDWKLAYHALRTDYKKTKEQNAMLLERIAENERRLGRLRTSNAYLASLSEWLPRLEATAQHYYTAATLSMDRNLAGLSASGAASRNGTSRQTTSHYTFPAANSAVHTSPVGPPSYMTPPSSVVSPSSFQSGN